MKKGLVWTSFGVFGAHGSRCNARSARNALQISCGVYNLRQNVIKTHHFSPISCQQISPFATWLSKFREGTLVQKSESNLTTKLNELKSGHEKMISHERENSNKTQEAIDYENIEEKFEKGMTLIEKTKIRRKAKKQVELQEQVKILDMIKEAERPLNAFEIFDRSKELGFDFKVITSKRTIKRVLLRMKHMNEVTTVPAKPNFTYTIHPRLTKQNQETSSSEVQSLSNSQELIKESENMLPST